MRAWSSSFFTLALLFAACSGEDGAPAPSSGGTGGAGGAGGTAGTSAPTGGTGGTGTNTMSGGAGGATLDAGGTQAADASTQAADASTQDATLPIDPDGTADWPSSAPVIGVDMAGMFGSEVSGLTLQPESSGARVLWASTNAMQARLYRLVESGGTWLSAQDAGWSAGKRLFLANGTGVPDAESVAIAEHDAQQIYIASERDLGEGFSLDSLPAIYRYDVSTDDAELVADVEWDLTESLPGLGANQGPEALTFIPDALLVAGAVIDDNTGLPYAPSDYPEHGSGLFVLGIEASGTLHVFALGANGQSVRITTIETELAGVMGLELDRDTGYLYAHCDDGCDNATVVMPVAEGFSRRVLLRAPEGLPNLNYEGIAIAPEAECTLGEKPFFWVEDGVNTHVLQQGAIACGDYL